MRFLIKFPTRNRPDKFIQVFLKYQHMLSGKHEVRFIVSMDEDDSKMNCDRIRKFLDAQPNVQYFYGHSKNKIQAINADLEHAGDFDIIMLASDDMIPKEPGYDQIIAAEMQATFSDGDGVLHYNDGRVGQVLNTFCIMGKKYYDRFGYLYYPGYQSVYCDNEFTDISLMLGRSKYIDRILFFHGWIDFHGPDELYRKNEDRTIYNIDKQLYDTRKVISFGITT